jgi:hypothetical protein
MNANLSPTQHTQHTQHTQNTQHTQHTQNTQHTQKFNLDEAKFIAVNTNNHTTKAASTSTDSSADNRTPSANTDLASADLVDACHANHQHIKTKKKRSKQTKPYKLALKALMQAPQQHTEEKHKELLSRSLGGGSFAKLNKL